MRKQILAAMVGLTVILGGCSKQSSQNTESTDSNQNIENMLQEVKKDVKEIKSGKVAISMSSSDEENRSIGYELNGDEKFDPTEYKLKGIYKQAGKDSDVELYLKDGVKFLKLNVGGESRWGKNKLSPGDRELFNFKNNAFNMQDSILNLLDNKDNWEAIKEGDKVTFKLKKNDEAKKKVEEEYLKTVEDDDDIRTSIKMLLQSENFEIIEASNGNIGIEKFKQDYYKVFGE